MYKGFNNELYLKKQTEYILNRVDSFGGKLYLELGGKLFDDNHASRVLPGYEPCNKIKVLSSMQEQVEIVIAINAKDIEDNKVRSDNGLLYIKEVIRLIDIFQGLGLYVGSVVITQYTGHSTSLKYKRQLEQLGIKVYRHYLIEGYPINIPLVVSQRGLGKNEYIETTKPVVVVTGPGPGSGKLSVCLSQLYQDNRVGKHTGYAKFETFPIWNLPLNHPVNLAYEAATADLGDYNMLDSYHLSNYGVSAVSYNRDMQAFPILDTILKKVYGEHPYKSPTDMGVNQVGFCITDMHICSESSKQEIIRRYYKALEGVRRCECQEEELRKIEWLLNSVDVKVDYRKSSKKAKEKSKHENGKPVVAIELPNGEVVTGKDTELLGATAGCILNALKYISGIDDMVHLIKPEAIEPIQRLKKAIGLHDGLKLSGREVLIALAASASDDDVVSSTLDNIKLLRNCDAHSTVILPEEEKEIYREIGINLTCEPKYLSKTLSKG